MLLLSSSLTINNNKTKCGLNELEPAPVCSMSFSFGGGMRHNTLPILLTMPLPLLLYTHKEFFFFSAKEEKKRGRTRCGYAATFQGDYSRSTLLFPFGVQQPTRKSK
jgi:hypothetical protein